MHSHSPQEMLFVSVILSEYDLTVELRDNTSYRVLCHMNN